MRRTFAGLLVAIPFVAFAQASDPNATPSSEVAQRRAELRGLAWQVGPTSGPIAGEASIKVPENYVYLDEQNTKKFLQIQGNPPTDGAYLVAPKNHAWFAIFEFSPDGYVKDDEKIDGDELLSKLKSSDGPQNEERKKLGLGTLTTVGWEVPPHYNTQTKRLEWGVRLRDETGRENVNYTERLLGRRGVMRAVLVSDPDTLDQDRQEFNTVLTNFAYNQGESYAEYRPGDHVAEYGLAALVLGGAAAVAAKKGFFTVLLGILAASWKAIVAGVVALSAGVKSFFKKRA